MIRLCVRARVVSCRVSSCFAAESVESTAFSEFVQFCKLEKPLSHVL